MSGADGPNTTAPTLAAPSCPFNGYISNFFGMSHSACICQRSHGRHWHWHKSSRNADARSKYVFPSIFIIESHLATLRDFQRFSFTKLRPLSSVHSRSSVLRSLPLPRFFPPASSSSACLLFSYYMSSCRARAVQACNCGERGHKAARAASK